ncbi:MAG: FecCD family ABC transporter permease [Sphaerochaetaceae bacterium]|jgi:iron complex transport system permease protein
MKKSVRVKLVAIILIVSLILLIGASLASGAAGISLKQAVAILASGPASKSSELFSLAQHRIIWSLRFPRALSAALAGALLAAAGMVFQALFRNPMADPYVLGISSGAAFGVSLAAFILPAAIPLGLYHIPVAAFMGAMGTALIIIVLSGGRHGSPHTLLLSGIALNFFLSALMTLLMYLNRSQLQFILQWTLGSFSSATWQKLSILSVCAVVGLIPVVFFTRELDIMLLDEASALSVGVSVKAIRFVLLLSVTLFASATVAFCGIIGFVGLMVPHIIRFATGPRHGSLLPLSLLGGASLALASDLIAKTAVAPSELPVGIITALAGSPLFFLLLMQSRRRNR